MTKQREERKFLVRRYFLVKTETKEMEGGQEENMGPDQDESNFSRERDVLPNDKHKGLPDIVRRRVRKERDWLEQMMEPR